MSHVGTSTQSHKCIGATHASKDGQTPSCPIQGYHPFFRRQSTDQIGRWAVIWEPIKGNVPTEIRYAYFPIYRKTKLSSFYCTLLKLTDFIIGGWSVPNIGASSFSFDLFSVGLFFHLKVDLHNHSRKGLLFIHLPSQYFFHYNVSSQYKITRASSNTIIH